MASPINTFLFRVLPSLGLFAFVANCMAQDKTNDNPQGRAEDQKKLVRQKLLKLGIAMHEYYDLFDHFPPSVLKGPDGKTAYSWRVELLPILEIVGDERPEKVLGLTGLTGDARYKAYVKHVEATGYRRSEPWDSEQNLKLQDRIPDVFRHPSEDSTNAAFFVITGSNTAFPPGDGIKLRDFADQWNETVLLVEARKSIPWTKPEDIPYDAKKPLPKFGGFREDGFLAAMCDAHVTTIPSTISEKDMRGLITRNGGEKLTAP